MTSIKLKFRASTVEGRPGTLYYQLYRHRTTKRINTRMRIRPEQWNSEEERLAPEKDNLGILLHYQQIINRDLGILRNIIDRLEAFRQEYSLDDIIEQYCSRHSEISSFKYIRDDIHDLILNGKLGTARNRNTPLAVISTSMGHTSEMTTRIYLAAIDESVIDNANRNVLAPLNRMARGLAGR